MAKTSSQSQQNQKKNNRTSSAAASDGNKTIKPTITKAKRTRTSTPRDSPLQRSSIYRGVTRHRWTGRYEAHLWDKNCWNESQNKKGRQVYLGAYDNEEAAGHAYDLAALKYWGPETILNFPLSTYQKELKEMEGQSREEYIGSLRRKSSGFSRGVSKYRGVARHHHNGRWEARIGRVFGNKYLYLGTYATQEEAATAYDMAAIEYRGLNAVTNFDLSRYIKWLRPNPNTNPNNSPIINPNNGDMINVHPNPMPELGLTNFFSPNQQQGEAKPTRFPSWTTNSSASSALGLLLQSSKFKEMLDRSTSDEESLLTAPESDLPRRSFPDDIQTYFDCNDSNSFGDGDESMFADLNSLSSPIFTSELDCN